MNANRPGAARPAGRNQQNSGPSKKGQQGGGVMFPPQLPMQYRKLIDGVIVTSVDIRYTAFGVTVSVVKADGSVVPLEQHVAAQKAAKALRLLDEDIARFRERIAERGIPVQPALPAGPSREELTVWLDGQSADNRRLLTMTNREFRAQQGANDEEV